MAIQPETIAGRKAFFRRKRESFVSTWRTDSNGYVHIPLKDGYEAVISGGKREIAAQFLWRLKVHVKPSGRDKLYAEAIVVEELRDQYGKRTSLHRVIVGAPSGLEVDHKDGNGLNCVDENLRICNRSQNAANRHYNNKNGYRGVVRYGRKFAAQIEYGGLNHYLGLFASPQKAALAYNAEAIGVFGEFAVLNNVPEGACQS